MAVNGLVRLTSYEILPKMSVNIIINQSKRTTYLVVGRKLHFEGDGLSGETFAQFSNHHVGAGRGGESTPSGYCNPKGFGRLERCRVVELHSAPKSEDSPVVGQRRWLCR